ISARAGCFSNLRSFASGDPQWRFLDVAAMRFECQPGCTTCCQQKGYVYLTEDDILRAAAFLNLSPAQFERKFVYRTTNLRRLRVPREAQCGFLREDGCSIHPAKPKQCRLFPFWPELVDDKKAW